MPFVLGCRRDWKAPIRDKVPNVLFAGGNGRDVVSVSRMVARVRDGHELDKGIRRYRKVSGYL